MAGRILTELESYNPSPVFVRAHSCFLQYILLSQGNFLTVFISIRTLIIMTISSLFQTGFSGFFILGLVSILTACGGGGGKKSSQVSTISSSISISSIGSVSSVSSINSSSISSVSVSNSSSTNSLAVNSSLNNSTVSTTKMMGGALQGVPLNIAGAVTTYAGSPPGSDGTGTEARFRQPYAVTTDGAYLYVADYNNHKIRKIEMGTGIVTTLAGSSSGDEDGRGTAAKFSFPEGVATEGAHLFVADTNNNKIRKIEIATGEVTTLAGSGSFGSADGTGVAASFVNPRGMTTDGNHLYVVDSGNNKIRKIEIATGIVTTLAGSGFFGSADGIAAEARFWQPYAITSYGAYLFVADTGNHKIRKIEIATGMVTTLAGSGLDGSADGIANAAGFYFPRGIANDGSHLYVADTWNNKIRKIDMVTGAVVTLAGGGLEGGADGAAAMASFSYPQGIATYGNYLYVTDPNNDKIRKIEIASGFVTTFAGASGAADDIGMSASFVGPGGITNDGANLYVADTFNNKIRKIEIATGLVTTLAGSGLRDNSDGTGAAAGFYYPQDITTDGAHLYVADTWNNKIRRIEIATGVVTTLVGSFDYPCGITTDSVYLYVADTGNHKIRKIEIATGMVTTLAGSGLDGSTDGTAAAASFNSPNGITTDGLYLYIADSGNNKIRKIEIATGVVTTLAGSGLDGGGDGTGAAASFYYPEGITTDGTNLYIADSDNNKIRKIEIATGVVTTLAGSTVGGVDGLGVAAKFNYPTGITTDGFVLFVADTVNDTIRKIE
jgi:sugar lactone lactonase YvrE